MRILLLADIHANLAALQAIDEEHDLCLFVGDLVDYGPDPGACVDWAREHVHYGIRGNHDHGVAQNVLINGKAGYKYLTGVTRRLSRELLDADQLHYLSRLPVTRLLTLDGARFLLVHGTPRDPMDEFAPPNEEFWERRLKGVEADVICVGHTHQPYVLEVGNKLVINPGSVGQPRDGDPRASYAVLEDRHVELKRVEYPIEETIRKVEETSLPEQAKRSLIEVYRKGGHRPAMRKE